MLRSLDVEYRSDSVDPNTDRLTATLSIVGRVGVAHERQFAATTRRTVERIGTQVTQFQDNVLSQHIGSILGVQPTVVRNVLDPKKTTPVLNDWSKRNVELIRAMDSSFVESVRAAIIDGFAKGSKRDVIAKRIQKRAGITQRRARNIARDQIGSLNAEVAEVKQRELGLDRYVWITSNDERVRPEHEIRRNKEFKWSDPPRDGHPGKPINCRCVAAPIVPKDLDLFS